MNIVVYYEKDKGMPDFYKASAAEYEKRLSRYCKLKKVAVSKVQQIKNVGKDGVYTFSVTPSAPSISSEALSERMETLAVSGYSTLQLVLGTYDAVAFDDAFSLSGVSSSPGLDVTVLLEQVYRGFRIMRGEPYHK